MDRRGHHILIGELTSFYRMIVGMNLKADDLAADVCKKKHITDMEADGSDEALRLVPHTVLSLEQSLEFIADD